MSKKVYIYYKENGELADAYQVQLASEDGTFGIKESNGTVVIPSGTSVTNPSTGRYEKSFDAENDIVYVVSWEILPKETDDPKYVTQQIGPFSDVLNSYSCSDFAGNFEQDEQSIMFMKTSRLDGMPVYADNLSVTITNSDGDVIDEGVPKIIKPGYYAYSWEPISTTTPSGQYLATWLYNVDGIPTTFVQNLAVVEKTDTKVYDKVYPEQVAVLESYIESAQCIPVLYEQARPSSDNKTFYFSFPRWNQGAGTKVYLNTQPVTQGIRVDFFKGTITFEKALTSYDVVNCDYNFRWFSDSDLAMFLTQAVGVFNTYPPHSRYTVKSINDKWIPGIVYRAATDALRKLLFSLQFQQPQQVFGGSELAKNAFSGFESLKKNYEEDCKIIFNNKKLGPYVGLTRSIVVPEFTLPGGRSRWFRYLFGTNSGS